MTEEWREIIIPVKFLVSSIGRVKSGITGKILTPNKRGGYRRIRSHHSVHVLVAKAFVPNPLNLPIVDHGDGDKANNADSNLEWVTFGENMTRAHDQKRITYCSGAANGSAILTEAEVLKIRRAYKQSATQVALAEMYGVSQQIISAIVRREVWKHV